MILCRGSHNIAPYNNSTCLPEWETLLHTCLIGFFKLPIVFLNKRNLFGVLSLLRFQHKHLQTLPCVFSVPLQAPLAGSSGASQHLHSDAREAQQCTSVRNQTASSSFCGTGHDTAINPPGSPGGCVFSLGTAWFGADVAVLSWALVGSVLKAEVLPLAGAERDLYA